MVSSRWSSWWEWCVASQQGWSISPKLTTSIVTWLRETFWSTVTWCAKCPTLACHATYRMTPLIPAIPALWWVLPISFQFSFFCCLSATGHIISLIHLVFISMWCMCRRPVIFLIDVYSGWNILKTSSNCLISFASIWQRLISFEGLRTLSPFQCLFIFLWAVSIFSLILLPPFSLYSASHATEVCHIFISVETCLLWEGSSLVDMPRVQRNQRALRPLKLTAPTLAPSLPPHSHSSFIITGASWEALAPH